MNKTNIIRLILAGLVLGSCGVINLAYADRPKPFDDKNGPTIPKVGQIWSKPSVLGVQEPEYKPSAALTPEQKIDSLLEQLKNTDPKIREGAFSELLNMLKDPQVNASIKQKGSFPEFCAINFSNLLRR